SGVPAGILGCSGGIPAGSAGVVVLGLPSGMCGCLRLSRSRMAATSLPVGFDPCFIVWLSLSLILISSSYVSNLWGYVFVLRRIRHLDGAFAAKPVPSPEPRKRGRV